MNDDEEPRRWRLEARQGINDGEQVEVMPVEEHEAIVEDLMKTILLMTAELEQLRVIAQATFDAAGNGDDALGMALVDLGLVLAGEESNQPASGQPQGGSEG